MYVLLWGLVIRVKRTVKTDVSVLNPHFILVTVLSICFVEVVNHALIYSDLIQSLSSLRFSRVNLDIYF